MLDRILWAFLALTVFATPAVAQTMDVEEAELGPSIWMLEDEDNVAYIIGTIHLLKPETQWRTAYFEELLASVDQVWFEADVHSPEAQAQIQALVPQLGLNPQGQTLSSMMSEDAKANLATLAQRMGVPAETMMASLDPLQPWLASVSLASAMAMAQGYDPQYGVEVALQAMIEPITDDVRYFETAEEQLGFFADLPHGRSAARSGKLAAANRWMSPTFAVRAGPWPGRWATWIASIPDERGHASDTS
jgi:uncharacterized protein YbaP (TraB family)